MPDPPATTLHAPRLIGHRGAPRDRRENTLAAFTRAVELGAEGIELDVHTTADGIPVVHHDPALGSGVSIASHDLRALTREARRLGFELPTLEAVLALPGGHAIHVELKGPGSERAAIPLIRSSGARARCAVHSFDHRAVLRARTLDDALPRGILLVSYLVDTVVAMRAAAARDLWMWWELIDEPLVREVHSAGGRVIAWTVNEPQSARQLAGLGVDALCTDDIPLLRAALDDVSRP